MPMKRALWIILGIGFAGLAFSGYLTYEELFAAEAAVACNPIGQPGTMLGYPPCVYGFAMYLAVVTVASLGLLGGRRHTDEEAEAPHPLDMKFT
jgi:uncharacterized membrane protein